MNFVGPLGKSRNSNWSSSSPSKPTWNSRTICKTTKKIMSYCVTLFQHTSKLKHEYWCWLSFRTNITSVSAALQTSLSSVLIYCRWHFSIALTKIMCKFITLRAQNWKRVINKLHPASVFIYPYFQDVILSDQRSCRFLWTWLSCRM